MKVLCTLNKFESFNEIKNLCDGIIITNELVSSRYDNSFTKEEILQLIKKCNTARMEVYLLMNAIFTDDNIGIAEDFINEFKDTNLQYIFGDLGVYMLLREANISKKGVYNPNTLIANYMDFEFWKPYKIKGLFPTLEIPLDDVSVIGKNKKVKMFYKGFGLSVMFHSRRKLLSNYKTHKNVLYDFVGSDDLTLIEETRNEAYKIIENEHGTHIFQPGIHNILPALDIIVDETDYLFLDGTFLDWQKYLEAVEIYKEALCDLDHLNLYNTKLEKIFDNLTYQFMYQDSVFRKGDF